MLSIKQAAAAATTAHTRQIQKANMVAVKVQKRHATIVINSENSKQALTDLFV